MLKGTYANGSIKCGVLWRFSLIQVTVVTFITDVSPLFYMVKVTPPPFIAAQEITN